MNATDRPSFEEMCNRKSPFTRERVVSIHEAPAAGFTANPATYKVVRVERYLSFTDFMCRPMFGFPPPRPHWVLRAAWEESKEVADIETFRARYVAEKVARKLARGRYADLG